MDLIENKYLKCLKELETWHYLSKIVSNTLQRKGIKSKQIKIQRTNKNE